MKGKRGNPGLQGKLLSNSMDAYIMALETINRLSLQYRISAFTYLAINAWELLLKAEVIKSTGDRKSIFFKAKKGQPPRTLSLRDCLDIVIPNSKDPARRNIARIAELRDEAVHLVIDEVPQEVLSLFQACVVNYHRRLHEVWGISLSDRVPAGMMTIVYDVSPEQIDLSNAVLRRKLGRDAVAYLSKFQLAVREEFDRLGKPVEFSIGIDFSLALVKQPTHGDIVLSKGPGGMVMGLVEVARDAGTTHPYRQTEVVEKINAALQGAVTINSYDIQSTVKVYNVRKRPEFFYQSTVRGSPAQYSPAFVDWVLQRYANDKAFFHRTRAKAKTI